MIIFNCEIKNGDFFQLMSTILSRIQEIVNNEGITIGALERAIGASKGVLSRAINNGTDIQSKWIQRIVENYPQYSADWFISGQGCMKKDNLADKKCTSPYIEANESIGNQLVAFLRDKDNTIREQAEEIGLLKERIRQLECELKKLASAAPNSTIANAV